MKLVSSEGVVVVGGGFMGEKIAKSYGIEPIRDKIFTYGDVLYCIPDGTKVIINAVGKTGRPNVDWCETHKPETYESNVHIPYLLAEYCKSHDIRLVHISSGCIYQGDNGGAGWSESDAPNFDGSYYSATKAFAERLLGAYNNVLMLRMRMPISDEPSERELIGKLLRYDKIIVEPNSVSFVEDFINALTYLVGTKATGIFNLTNRGTLTHKDILEAYEEAKGVKLNKTYILASELVTDAPRSNTILNSEKIGDYMRPARMALAEIMERYVKNGG